jgi:hypothetical protein
MSISPWLCDGSYSGLQPPCHDSEGEGATLRRLDTHYHSCHLPGGMGVGDPRKRSLSDGFLSMPSTRLTDGFSNSHPIGSSQSLIPTAHGNPPRLYRSGTVLHGTAATSRSDGNVSSANCGGRETASLECTRYQRPRETLRYSTRVNGLT